MTGVKSEYLKLMNARNLIGDEFPEYIAYREKQVYNKLEDVHSVGSATELQTAIDNIGTGAGTIFIEAGTHVISSTIDVDGGGTIVIYGHGDNTILKPDAGINIFNVTDGIVIIEKLKLDLTNYTTNIKGIIINETNNKVSTIEKITITGDGVNGIGIELSSNNCRINNCDISNIDYGINVLSDDNILSGNNCDNCVTYGINIDGDDNNFIANIIETNGIGINLTISADSNRIRENKVSGNTVQWSDNGTNNDIEYRCSTAQDIQDAINSIATKSGIVHIISGTISLTATIDLNGGGHYIIEGEGDGTVIDCNADRTAFNITDAKSGTTLKNLKIDAVDLTAITTKAVTINEGSNNKIIVDNLTIVGDGTNGYGIYLNSDNCIIERCWMQDVRDGIYLDTVSYCKIKENTCYSNNRHGIYLSESDYNTVKENICYDNARDGIHVITASGNAITGNVCYNNTFIGIHLKTTANYNAVSGNNCYGNSNEGIYIHTAHNNSITGNICNNNDTCGIWLNDSDNNTISGNTCNDNDLDDANVFAGIYLSGDSDYNTISGNTCNNNNNIGVGTGHGIRITDNTCNDNTVMGNTALGNDANYVDNGTNTFASTTTHGDPLNNFVAGAG